MAALAEVGVWLMIDEHQVRQAVASVFAAEPAEIEVLPSGVVTITVRLGDRAIVIDSNADRTLWCVSKLDEDSSPFTGHDRAVGSLADALALARAIIRPESA